ncbi:MAG: EamA family transporter [Oscillospiraceae bacterium]|nr:EamA family transporter [Oscillospiraceae bacterium]
MIYLLLAILCSALISLIMRVSEDHVSAKKSMLATNYFICMSLAAGFVGFGNLLPQDTALPRTLAMGAVNGAFYLAGFLMFQLSVPKYGLVMSSIFMKMGLLVPITLSLLLFGERPTAVQILGFAIAVCAIIALNMKKGERGSVGAGLLVLLLSAGSSNAMSKVYEEYGSAALKNQFLFYTFFSACLLCTLLVLKNGERPCGKDLLFGVIIGVPNFFSSRFLLLSLSSVPAVIAYPTFSVAAMLIVTLAGVVLFGEKLTRQQWLALGGILLALILLNI